MKIFVNHIGYRPDDRKLAVIEGPSHLANCEIQIVHRISGDIRLKANLIMSGAVDEWKDWNFLTADFTELKEPGLYYLLFSEENKHITSETFEIEENILPEKTISDLLFYFKSMRCSGDYDRQDSCVPVFGSKKTVDAHGGWYDASGDTSKYLSHLSYANFLNPQQTPMIAWNLIESLSALQKSGTITGSEMEKRFTEEILQGADFLMRMQDESGFFYMILFDQWSKDLQERMLCSYSGQDGNRWESYQAAYRQGGGVSIAMLARTASLTIEGDYKQADYLLAAIKGFDHLEEHNLAYLDDGKENIIDDYCALLAASELFNVTGEARFRNAAERRASNLMERIRSDENYRGWLLADDDVRPYFHGAEAGLPALALIRFTECVKEGNGGVREKVLDSLEKMMRFELSITCEVNNPFGYARQYTKGEDSKASGAFFIPHNNPSGYWWQGENARLASLASAAIKSSRLFPDEKLSRDLQNYALDQINWIVGCNPYNMCMLQGHGANNPVYEKDFINNPGGIANGITSGFENENDIDFAPEGLASSGDHSWRWGEQWIPHAGWFILAVSLL